MSKKNEGGIDPIRLVKYWGTPAQVAREMRVSRQAVDQWLLAGKVPADKCDRVELLTRGDICVNGIERTKWVYQPTEYMDAK